MTNRFIAVGIVLLALALLVGGGSAGESVAAAPAISSCMQQGPQQDPHVAFMPYQLNYNGCPAPVVWPVPFQQEWATSPHNDATSEAFSYARLLNNPSCAKCHFTEGYLDFLGADGTPPGVDSGVAQHSTIKCVACHNDVTWHKTSVVFPSGVMIEDLGDESRCMECHQGRESGVSVETRIATAALPDDDTPSSQLSFPNIHYYAAASTMYGSLVNGGYEYEGMSYDQKFSHVEDYDQCYECHEPHTLQIDDAECTVCHSDGMAAQNMAVHSDYRTPGSLGDYDGDGNFTEGIAHEVEALAAMLLTAIEAYAEQHSQPILYDETSHPYWFLKVDGQKGGAYNAFTNRLLKAAYNYQVAHKDPGQYAHNAKYIIQLLHDSIADLNTKLTTPVDISKAWRDDPGHFAGSTEAFRHWDEEGEVPGGCARCHSSEGLPMYHKEGVNISVEPSNGFMCTTCHMNLGGAALGAQAVDAWELYLFDNATFPSGDVVGFGNDAPANTCLQCHQGRASGQSVVTAIAGKGLDTVDTSLRFINVHYFAAGATLFGSAVNGLYEFEGKAYAGQFMHVDPFNECTECHSTHQLGVRVGTPGLNCGSCHAGITTAEQLEDIRWFGRPDYDGDGNTTEGIAHEIETMMDQFYAAMQAYALATPGVGAIVYNGSRYPYFFTDTGASFRNWTPRLVRAAYILQYVKKDPGQFAHNGKYVIQVLYDAMEDIGADMTGKVRP